MKFLGSYQILVYLTFPCVALILPFVFLQMTLMIMEVVDSENPATRLVNACEFFFLVTVAESQMGHC